MSEICCDDDVPCQCLATDLLDAIGRKYAMDVVCVVANHDTVRFGEIEDHLPDASTSTISARLDELEGEGLVDRQPYDEIPPRVEYELTDDGEELGERLKPVIEWIVAREGGSLSGSEDGDDPPGSSGDDNHPGKRDGDHPGHGGGRRAGGRPEDSRPGRR